MGQYGILCRKEFSPSFYRFFRRYPHLLELCKIRRSRSLLELANRFNVDLETLLLALWHLKREGIIKDVKFI